MKVLKFSLWVLFVFALGFLFGGRSAEGTGRTESLESNVGAAPARGRELGGAMRSSEQPGSTPGIADLRARLKDLDPRVLDSISKNHDDRLLIVLLEEVARRDFWSAVEVAGSLEDGGMLHTFVSRMVNGENDIDPFELYQWLATQDGRIDRSDYHSFLGQTLREMARSDPDTASQLLGSIESDAEKEELVQGLAEGWAAKGVDQAFDWLAELAEEDGASSLVYRSYQSIMRAYIEQDPVDASDAVLELESDSLQSYFVEPIVRRLAADGLDGAMEWVMRLEGGQSRSIGAKEIVRRFSESDPVRVLEFLAKKNHGAAWSPDWQLDAYSDIAHWYPDLVARSVQNADPSIRLQAVREVSGIWMRQDVEKALAWIGEIPSGPMRDVAADSAVEYFKSRDPGLAVSWIGEMGSAERRVERCCELIDYASVEDLPAMRESLRHVPLQENERERLERAIAMRVHDQSTVLVLPR